MKTFSTIKLMFIMLFLFVKKSESLKCFVCRSDRDDECNKHVNQSYSKECPVKKNGSEIYCRKISQKLKFKNEKSWTSIRECAYEKGHPNCYRFKWLDIGYQETCECEKENCNLGGSETLNILTVALLFSLAWIYNFIKTYNT